MAAFHPIVKSMRSRRMDRFGAGHYGASRGKRKHNGLDIETAPGEEIYSPIHGDVVRQAFPYANDLSYGGVVIRGVGQYAEYEVKLFYVQGLICGRVSAGSTVATAQNLGAKYPGITNHVHMEVRCRGTLLDPTTVYGMCF